MSGAEVGRPFTVTADGETLAAAWFGKRHVPGEPAIVLLHEGLGSISMWENFPTVLAATFDVPVLAYDRQGHGGSARPNLPRPNEWMRHEALTVLPAVVAGQGIQDPLLFGHSDGATIALIHAAHHKVRGVVSEAAHVFQDNMMLKGARKATGQWAYGVLRRFLTKHHGEHAEMLLTGWLDWWRNARCRDWDMMADLALIACPVLAIQGSEDAYGTSEQVRRICESVAGKGESLFLPDVGHIPHHEARPAVMKRMAAWAARHKLLEV